MLMIESCRYCDYKAVMLLADTVYVYLALVSFAPQIF